MKEAKANNEELLLKQLETEGRQIAKYRKKMSTLINSGQEINSYKLASICERLNYHIKAFDKIDYQLTRLEALSSQCDIKNHHKGKTKCKSDCPSIRMFAFSHLRNQFLYNHIHHSSRCESQ